MFEWLSGYDKILVTGPPRSGTRICAHMIARDTGHRYVDEFEISIAELGLVEKLCQTQHKFVLQCPGIFLRIHQFVADDTAIIVVVRDIDEIVASRKRVRMGYTTASTIKAHYDTVTIGTRVNYTDLVGHPLWVTEEERRRPHWRMVQWRVREPMFLLVNPHETTHGEIYSHPPLGIMYLESALVNAGVQCLITDGYLWGFEGIKQAIDRWRPHYVGITALTPGRHKALEVARYARNVGSKVILGGVHFAWMWKQVMDHYDYVDIIVLGEGEEAIVELGKGKHPSEIHGIVWRDENIIVKNPARPYIQDLDAIPFPRWDWMMPQIPQYLAKGGGGPRLIFSRGCTGRCKFCSTTAFWRGYRCRSPGNFADEVEWLASLGCPHFCLADDAFSLNLPVAKEMLRELARRQLPIAFYATTRPDALDEEICHLLMAARCDHVSMGLESGSQAILDRMGKQNTVEQNKQVIKWCKQAGLKVTALMIEGNVGETAQTAAETRRFLNETKPEGMGSVKDLWILPGTRFYKEMNINDDFWLGPEPYYVYRGELDGPDWKGGHFL